MTPPKVSVIYLYNAVWVGVASATPPAQHRKITHYLELHTSKCFWCAHLASLPQPPIRWSSASGGGGVFQARRVAFSPKFFFFFYNNFFSFSFLPLGCSTHSLVTRPNTRLLAQWSLHPSYLPQQFFFYIFPFLFFYFCFSFFLPPEGDFRRSLPKVAPITTTTTYPR